MKTFKEFTPLNEVSQKLALAVANKRTKQGMAHRLAQSKVNPNASAGDKRFYKSLGSRADTLYGKAQKSYEYAFRKGVAKGEKLAKEEVTNESVKGRIAFRRLFPAKSQKRFETKFPAGPPIKVSVKRPIGHTIADIGPGKKEYNVKTVKEDVQLDELKGSTLKSYIRKSYGDIGHHSGMIAHVKVRKYKSPVLQKASADSLKFHTRKEKNRGEGIDRAVTKLGEEVQLDETMTRKHFQQVADVIKAHPDAAKREELAKHHAAIFKASNPRFDHKRFYSAANVVVKEGNIPGLSHLDAGDAADKSWQKQERARHRASQKARTQAAVAKWSAPHAEKNYNGPVKEDHSPEHLNYIFAKAEHPKEYAASKVKKPKVKRMSKDAIYKSLGMTKVKGALGGTYYEGVEKWRSLDNPMQTKSVPKYQIGSTVKPKIGPHKGTNHTVIHVHADGSYNIKPEVHVSSNRYRQGAARAQEKDLE
mgnify:CR=1 FL=1